ncbi:MAG TPA: tetratricopeptide repeat protein [Acidobacteriota bacterium]|jgi:tetratricopeptide (TPR) repeat protein
MKKLSLIFILLFCGISFGAEIDLRFENANQVYRNGGYDKAAKVYEEILAQGYESPELYYNLGNCYYKLNNIPAAILQFERARKLKPQDEDIAHNLTLANLRTEDRIDPIPDLFFVNWWRKWTELASADQWAMIGLVSLWLALFMIIGIFYIYRSLLIRRILSITALLALLLFAFSFVAALNRHALQENHKFAIVFTPSTDVKSAPDEQSTGLFVLHSGVKVELIDRVGDWNKVRLADGKVGWMQASNFKVI